MVKKQPKKKHAPSIFTQIMNSFNELLLLYSGFNMCQYKLLRSHKGHEENKRKIGQERSSMQQAHYQCHRPTPWMQESVSMHKSPTPVRHSRMNQARSEEEEKERKRDRKDRGQETDGKKGSPTKGNKKRPTKAQIKFQLKDVTLNSFSWLWQFISQLLTTQSMTIPIGGNRRKCWQNYALIEEETHDHNRY